ncbi:MAG: hypothetical protein AAGA54_00450 [Myxococcota bacterium]
MIETVSRAIGVAVCFGAAGALTSLAFVLEARDPTAAHLVPAAAFAAALVSALVWPHCTRAPSLGHGALRGAAIGFLAHPVLWMLMLGHVGTTTPGLTTSPAAVLAPALVLGLFSTLAYGPLTMSVGAALGGLLARCEPPLPRSMRLSYIDDKQ